MLAEALVVAVWWARYKVTGIALIRSSRSADRGQVVGLSVLGVRWDGMAGKRGS